MTGALLGVLHSYLIFAYLTAMNGNSIFLPTEIDHIIAYICLQILLVLHFTKVVVKGGAFWKQQAIRFVEGNKSR